MEGTISGHSLHEVIQLHCLNCFSGCITVQNRNLSGLLFFRDGNIVHAEQGKTIGEEALQSILDWHTGHFNIQFNVTTTSHSIHKNIEEIIALAGLNNCHPRPNTAVYKPITVTANSIIKRLKRVPGVIHSTLQTKDGVSIVNDGFATEELAGQASYLAMVSNRLSSIFRSGEFLFVSVQGTHKHLLLYSSKSHYLSVSVSGDSQLGIVDSEIRKILSGN
jgi:predicted regulator of Ras-like GTPase activity (Roadblock/LC7/MglB family)